MSVLIILPTYNRSEKCKNVIQNIKDQKYLDWILYVIDDHSKIDEYLNLKTYIDTLNNNKIKFIRNNVNKKIAGTLNVGLQYFLENNFDYITWISDDNVYYTNFINDLCVPNYDFIYSAFLYSDETNKYINKILQNYKYIDLKDIICNFRGLASFMWSRNAINIIGFYDDTLYGTEDYEYIIRTFLNIKENNIFFQRNITMEYIRSNISLYFKENGRIISEVENIKKKYCVKMTYIN